MNKLGTELKKRRERAGLSARTAAIRIGATHPTVISDERTGKGLTLDRLNAYADLYGVSVATLARLSKKARRKVQKCQKPATTNPTAPDSVE